VQGGGAGWAAATLALFALALISKESAVALVPLMLLPVWFERPPARRWATIWAAAAALALVYTALVFRGSANHLHFHDGTFNVHAPFWITIPRSMFRLFWIQGLLAAAALAAYRAPRERLRLAAAGAVWAAIAFVPYSFLTYMPYVPSRHTYLASVGLALAAGAALVTASERTRHPGRAAAALLALLAIANCGYLWTRKQRQFAERAAPTEQLVEFVRRSHRPVYVHCFPYGFVAADWAVQLRLGKQVHEWQGPPDRAPANAALFCFPPGRHAEAGNVVSAAHHAEAPGTK
jgi:hypothetical protein